MLNIKAWWQAARPLAQANIAVPLVLGQCVAFSELGFWDPWMSFFTHLWGLLAHLLIVFANDLADEEADRLNTKPTILSGGSRVLPDGVISAKALKQAAMAVSAALVLLGIVLSVAFHRPQSVFATIFLFVLMWAYSYPPLRLSYRGEGELLQALGVGVVLPWFAYAMQTGRFTLLPMWILCATFLLAYAGNIATALPDIEADRKAYKQTLAIRFGENFALNLAFFLTVISCLMAFYFLGGTEKIAGQIFLGASSLVLMLRLFCEVPSIKSHAKRRLVYALFLGGSGQLIQLLLGGLMLS